jgi:hypothetical protein
MIQYNLNKGMTSIKFDAETAARLLKDFVGSQPSDIREIAKIIASDNLMKQLQPDF